MLGNCNEHSQTLWLTSRLNQYDSTYLTNYEYQGLAIALDRTRSTDRLLSSKHALVYNRIEPSMPV